MPKYLVEYFISGTSSLIVEAEDEAKAKALAEEQFDEDDFDCTVVDVGDVTINSIQKVGS